MSASLQTAERVGIFDGPYYLSIAGKLVGSAQTLDVINPATAEVLAKAPSAAVEQLEEAIAAAKEAFRSWAAIGYDARQNHLNAYADALELHHDELAHLLTQEQGKPLKTMAEPEADQAISWVR